MPKQWQQFHFIEGDIRRLEDCRRACAGVDYVLHQAALGSVPLSLENPLATNASNIDGFVNMLVASCDAGVKRFIYAGSSSVYGDDPSLPKMEDAIGRPLSPYALTKYVNEAYAGVFARNYGLPSVGLRYFNVFGKRQNASGAYSAVIPKWIAAMMHGEPVHINGDGETSRDFCHVDNVIQANILAALCEDNSALNQVYNIAVGERTTLNELYQILHGYLLPLYPHLKDVRPEYRSFRPGDIRHSLADIAKARRLLGYAPPLPVKEGLRQTMDWYTAHLSPAASEAARSA